MRYAIVSDLHANLQAWNAVLLDIRSSRIDQIICLGDVVGYGPRPAEVLKSAYANIDHFVLGMGFAEPPPYAVYAPNRDLIGHRSGPSLRAD